MVKVKKLEEIMVRTLDTIGKHYCLSNILHQVRQQQRTYCSKLITYPGWRDWKFALWRQKHKTYGVEHIFTLFESLLHTNMSTYRKRDTGLGISIKKYMTQRQGSLKRSRELHERGNTRCSASQTRPSGLGHVHEYSQCRQTSSPEQALGFKMLLTPFGKST